MTFFPPQPPLPASGTSSKTHVLDPATTPLAWEQLHFLWLTLSPLQACDIHRVPRAHRRARRQMTAMLSVPFFLIPEQFPHNLRAKPDSLVTWVRCPGAGDASLLGVPRLEEAKGRSECSEVPRVASGARAKGAGSLRGTRRGKLKSSRPITTGRSG